jgi:beta-hydroxylase
MLADVNWLAPKFIVLYVFLASMMYVHLRGRVRHKFYRQLTDHSTFLAPYNALMYMFSAVPIKPFVEVGRFPELAPLSENWKTIRDEALKLFDEGHIRAAAGYTDLGFNSFFRRGWKRFYVKWYDEPLPSAKALCPKTVALVQSIPNVNGAMFALLPPGGDLGKHRDPFAGSLRYHLGLVTPNADTCKIWVDGEMYSWRDGEAVMFDETYIHYAENTTSHNRIILFCDVERPMKYRWAAAFNRWFSRTVMSAAGAPNEAGDRTGGLNRLFSRIYKVRLHGKQLKKRNRTLYHLEKWSIFAGLLVVIILI